MDSGETWLSQASGTGNGLSGIVFVNSQDVWAVGDSMIVHTNDGGETWQPQENPADSLSGICYDGGFNLWVVGGWETILRYTDPLLGNPRLDIATDKIVYHRGDSMTVYADVINPGDAVPDAVLALYFVRVPWVFPVRIIPFDMPADYEVYDWEVLTIPRLPSLRRSTYAFLGVLASRSEGILDFDIAVWALSTSPSAMEAARLRRVAEDYVSSLTWADLKNTRTVDLRDLK